MVPALRHMIHATIQPFDGHQIFRATYATLPENRSTTGRDTGVQRYED